MNLNSKILSDKIKNLIIKLNNEFPDIVFGGSIILNGVGLIERKIGDIDIFVPEKHRILQSNYVLDYIKSENNKVIEKSEEQPKNIFDYFEKQANFVSLQKLDENAFSENGEFTLRTGIEIDDVHVCIFEVQNLDELKSFRLKIDNGIEVNAQNIFHALKTKCLYIKKSFSSNLDKHYNDLLEIYNLLKPIDSDLKRFENKENDLSDLF